MRWGISWKPLRFTLKHNCNVIDAAMRLHNFIVEFREEMKETTLVEDIERELFSDDCRRFLAVHPTIDDGGVYGGEDDVRLDHNGNPLLGGRPWRAETESKNFGINLRNLVRDDIDRRRLVRPRSNWYQENNRVMSSSK